MSSPEQHHFQAEIQQVLDIVIHSLYTDREIFIRELISNAADACEKLRFKQSSGAAVRDPDLPLTIQVVTDEKAGTITVTDTGVGMNHGELVENLGTIAHSGTKSFLKVLESNQEENKASLIGKFGVGFYSAFMVAEKVTVWTRSHAPEEEGWKWFSEGAKGYVLEAAADLPRGTKILLELKESEKHFASEYELETIIKRYSNFVQFPIELNGKRLNTVQAIWSRSKNEIKEEEYKEFYHYIGHDHEDPTYRLHFSADAPLSIQALLFVPSRNVEALGMSRTESEVNLYCRKVLIQSKAKGLLPEWLRFLKGVVDSEDLPLNISRETMQDSSLMQKLNKVLTGRFIKFLEEQSTKDPEAYKKFYQEFSRYLKEGVITDFTHREAAAKLLRFESSILPSGETCSLADYLSRSGADDKEIYYLVVPDRSAAEKSPYAEVFLSRKKELLFLYDPWDEFVMENLSTFEGKLLKAAEKSDLKIENPAEDKAALPPDQAKDLAGWMKGQLGDQIADVRVSERLVDSPVVILDNDQHMTHSMRKILKSMKQEQGMKSSYVLEINPRHPILQKLEAMRGTKPALATQVTEQLVDNAKVAAGILEDPRSMVGRLNSLLESVLEK